MIFLKAYDVPPYNINEILRYSGAKIDMEGAEEIINECIKEAEASLSYKACYGEFPVNIAENTVKVAGACIKSRALAENLRGCEKVLIFAATVGIGIDKLITKYGSLSTVKVLFFQGLGAERIEALCDAFCADMEEEYGPLRQRFSPGYGDFDISYQGNIFSILDPTRKIGITLNKSFLMSPSKSVTAIVGIGKCENSTKTGCRACGKTNCEFRKKEF